VALTVNAGADQTIQLRDSAAIVATISGNTGTVRKFWRKMSGGGKVTWGCDAFNASHEDGTHSEWTAPVGGFVKGSYEGGAMISQDRAYSGSWSWRGYNDPALPSPGFYSAKVSRWNFDYTIAYFSAWYWLPTDYDVLAGEPVNIFQFKERTTPFDPTWVAYAKHYSPTGNDIIGLFDQTLSVAHDNSSALLPKGEWFNLTAYQKQHRTTGELFVWLNGVKYYGLTGINTLGNVSNNNPESVMWGIANYANTLPAKTKSIYADDCRVVNDTSNQLSTSASFSEPGTYTLRLTATDDNETVSDDMTVIVEGGGKAKLTVNSQSRFNLT
jgi:hypothetical protein